MSCDDREEARLRLEQSYLLARAKNAVEPMDLWFKRYLEQQPLVGYFIYDSKRKELRWYDTYDQWYEAASY